MQPTDPFGLLQKQIHENNDCSWLRSTHRRVEDEDLDEFKMKKSE